MPDNDRKLKREARRRQRAWKKNSSAKGLNKPKKHKNTSCTKGRCKKTKAKKPTVKKPTGNTSNFLKMFNNRRTVKSSDKEDEIVGNHSSSSSSSSKNPRFL